MFTATDKQITTWKKEHGEIFRIVVEDKACYLKKPSRKALGYAAVAAKDNPMKYTEVLLDDCWLGGDEEIKTNDDLFLSVSPKIVELNDVKTAELVKL